MKLKKLLIETPEKIIFTYNIAETGTRIAAYVLDILFQLIILVVMFILFGLSIFSSDVFNTEQSSYYIAVIYILLFLFQWGYFLFFETVMNGKTPGKKICGIRVIRDNGERLDFQSLVIRNLLRSADSIPIPFFNLLGGLVAVISRQSKRLGDYAAGTVVVSDSLFKLEEPYFETKLKGGENTDISNNLGKIKLKEKDLFILRKLINERNTMPPESSERTAGIIVSKLEKKYDISMIIDKSNFEVIEEIYKAQLYENKK